MYCASKQRFLESLLAAGIALLPAAVARAQYRPVTGRYLGPSPSMFNSSSGHARGAVRRITLRRRTVSARQQAATLRPATTVSPHANALSSSQGQVQPPANAPLSNSVVHLTPANIQQMASQLRDHQLGHVTAVSQALNHLAAADPHPPSSQASAARTNAQRVVNRVQDHVKHGNLSGQDLADLAAGIQAAFPPGGATPPAGRRRPYRRRSAGQQLADWEQRGGGRAQHHGPKSCGKRNSQPRHGRQFERYGGYWNFQPGGRGQQSAGWEWSVHCERRWSGPQGGEQSAAGRKQDSNPLNIAIGRIRVRRPAWIIPVDGGDAALIGMGQPGDDIELGEGDPDQAAGLDVPPPDESPAPASSDPPATGDVILTNAATGPVSYTVNDNPFSEKPNYEQSCRRKPLRVAFDRGNGKGTAQYQLSEGFYEFTVGSQGWDLSKKEFQHGAGESWQSPLRLCG